MTRQQNNFADKKCIVTGGAGFIGSHLVEKLVFEGAYVVVVDNYLTGSRKNLSELEEHPKLQVIKYDLARDTTALFSDLRQLFDSYDYLFHLASPASPRGYIDNPITTFKVNSFGTYALAEFARENDAAFIYASTSEAYGNPLVHPQPETYWGNVNPVGIRSSYDVSKRFGEMVLTTLAREFDQDVRIARIFNTYGPRMQPEDGRVIPNFVTQALAGEPLTVHGDGKQTRSFCYVDDLVEYFIRIALRDEAQGEVINIGNPDEFTVLEFAKLVISLSDSNSNITYVHRPKDDPDKRKPDISKARTLLGYSPSTSIEKGLQKTIDYFKKTSL